MPIGAAKGFTVWTKANHRWICKLLEFLLEKEFVTAEEILNESKKPNKSHSGRAHGNWGMRPNIHQINNLLKHKLIWVVESDKKIVNAYKSWPNSRKILWELSPNWEKNFIEYQASMMNRADMLTETAGVKWK
tara:strand:- start:4235 stop:4633 length:399 start_codon:yes stop_codon:yes gene_type:complete